MLKMRPAVQGIEFGDLFRNALDAEANRFVRRRVHRQGPGDSPRQLVEREAFQEPQYFDVFPLALLAGLGFQASAQHVELFRQLPSGERGAEIETVGTLRGNR